MDKNLFVWDFHGVMEEGNEKAVVEISNMALENLDYSERFSYEVGESLYGKKWYEYFEYLLPNETHENHLELQDLCFEFSLNNPELISKHMSATPGLDSVLSEINNSKHDQVLISNTRNNALHYFISSVGADKYFEIGQTAFATDGHSKDSKNTKEDKLNNLLENKYYSKLIIIGDSPSDIALGELGDSVTFLFTHPYREHKECEADYKINDFKIILEQL